MGFKDIYGHLQCWLIFPYVRSAYCLQESSTPLRRISLSGNPKFDVRIAARDLRQQGMESDATDKPVPREINALLSDERLILRETQRAVMTLPRRDRGFHCVSRQDRLRGGGSATHADSLAIAESY